MADQISDAILDAIIQMDPGARVACEVAVTTGLVMVMGEITTECYVDIPRIVRRVVDDIGYTRAKMGFDAETCAVVTAIDEQSPDIAGGVDGARRDDGDNPEGALDDLGAGDQGIMYGFACRETEELMPLPITLAHGLARRLAGVRREGVLPYLWPDGKAQVTIAYEGHEPAAADSIVVSCQHQPDVSLDRLHDDVMEHVIKPVVPPHLITPETRIFINPSGRFVIGGPLADVGLTGRKIIVDTYGGYARHGGGAFSGKDPTKVDRTGAYAARYIAKNIVAAGLAQRCEVELAYAIGVAEPLAVYVDTFGTGAVSESRIQDLVKEHFQLRPGAIIRDLGLLSPIYRQVAAYGHFGRSDLDLPWERTDRAPALREAAGLPGPPPS